MLDGQEVQGIRRVTVLDSLSKTLLPTLTLRVEKKIPRRISLGGKRMQVGK